MSSGQEVGVIFGEGTGPATALLRSPTVIIASIALWGMNVSLFRLFGIDYVQILLLDLKKDEEEESKIRRKKHSKGGITHEEVPTSENVADKASEIELSGISQVGETDLDGDRFLPQSNLSEDPSNLSGIKYSPNYEITEVKLLSLALLLILTLYSTSYVWIQIGRGSTIGAIFFFYCLVFVIILLPIQATAWIRVSVRTVLTRARELVRPRCSCIHGRPKPVPFIDVFFADAMCSLSKVFFDWGMLCLMASHYPHPVPASGENIIIPSCCASLPYLIRARQCLVMYNVGKHAKDPNRYQHVLNAIKYSTSLFPLIVSAYQKTDAAKTVMTELEIFLIILLVINATYSLIWDITMDWGMMKKPNIVVERAMGQCVPSLAPTSHGYVNCLDAALRPRLRFGTALTLVVVALDIFLRFSWTLRFVSGWLFPSTDSYILCTEFLEVFRRSVWNLLRVEWEHIKQSKSAKKRGNSLLELDALKAVSSPLSAPTNTIMSTGVVPSSVSPPSALPRLASRAR